MKNLLTTIPQARFKSWSDCEAELVASDGEDGSFWTVAANFLPKEVPIGALMYIVFKGEIRGYMDIVNVDVAKNWSFHDGGKAPFVFVLANWHPITPVPQVGFQGWRYTALRP